MEHGITLSTNINNTRSLIRTLKYVLDILQTEEAFTLEEYKHTHIQQVTLAMVLERLFNIRAIIFCSTLHIFIFTFFSFTRFVKLSFLAILDALFMRFRNNRKSS